MTVGSLWGVVLKAHGKGPLVVCLSIGIVLALFGCGGGGGGTSNLAATTPSVASTANPLPSSVASVAPVPSTSAAASAPSTSGPPSPGPVASPLGTAAVQEGTVACPQGSIAYYVFESQSPSQSVGLYSVAEGSGLGLPYDFGCSVVGTGSSLAYSIDVPGGQALTENGAGPFQPIDVPCCIAKTSTLTISANQSLLIPVNSIDNGANMPKPRWSGAGSPPMTNCTTTCSSYAGLYNTGSSLIAAYAPQETISFIP